MKQSRVLILTLSAGGGHVQAAKAKKEQLLLEDPTTLIYEVDILADWINSYFGKWGAGKWNEWQRVGNVKSLQLFINLQFAADLLFYPFFFFHALKTVFTKKIDRIIDTQVLGTAAIIRAIRFYDYWTHKKIILEKVLTELPTSQVTHSFSPIKRLSAKSKAYLKLYTTHPLLLKGENEQDFWKTQCRLSPNQIVYDALPLRKSFLQMKDQKFIKQDLLLPIKPQSEKEKEQMLACLHQGKGPHDLEGDNILLEIGKEDRVSVIMLGSRPSEPGTLQYLHHFLRARQALDGAQKKKDWLFVFCSKDRSPRGLFYDRVVEVILKTPSFPENLCIVPLTFQSDTMIAPLFFRADATITRSGGLTSMELLTICHGKIFIHSEPPVSKKKKINMPPWEEGNAHYLEKKKGAKIVLAPLFYETCYEYLSN
jgi:hypothetical protein